MRAAYQKYLALNIESQRRVKKKAVFWFVAPCILYADSPANRGSKHLRNVGDLPDYMAQQPERQPSWNFKCNETVQHFATWKNT
jgi:hypothetical protein